MGIVYLGDVERVSRELTEARDTLDAQYRKILGEERTRRLDEVSGRVLDERSFYSDRAKLSDYSGQDIRGPNKFLVTSDSTFEVDRRGYIKTRKIRTAPIFYISEDGFQQSASASFTERRLVSFVHEFDHYLWYALQRVPCFVVSLGILDYLDVPQEEQDFRRLVEDLIEKGAPRDEFMTKFGLVNYFMFMHDVYEKANMILDNAVLQSIGVQRGLPWRGKEKTYTFLPLPYPNAAAILPTGGDPFANLDDAEVIDRFIKWEDYYRLRTFSDFIRNLMRSVTELRVSRVPFSELQRMMQKRKIK